MPLDAQPTPHAASDWLMLTAHRGFARLQRVVLGATPVKGGYYRDKWLVAERAGVPLYTYAEQPGSAIAMFRDAVASAIATHLPREPQVVEIGTGAGFIAARLLAVRSAAEYLSFEPERYLSRHLDKWLGACGLRTMPCRGADLEGVSNASCDAVISYGVFTVIDVAPMFRYLDEAARVLKPGGVLAFDVFDTDAYGQDMADMIALQTGRGQSRPYLSVSFLEKHLASLGFEGCGSVPNPSQPFAAMHLFRRL